MIESSRRPEPIPDNHADSFSSNRRHGNFFHKSIYGSCWGNEIAWTQATAVQNTWYKISDADMQDGLLSGVTHDGSGLLTVATAGVYKIDYTLTVETSASGKHVQTGPSISGADPTGPGWLHEETKGANMESQMAGVAFLSLAAGATVQIAVRTTDTGTPNLLVDHLNITVLQVAV